ncbi:MAG TPA: TraB/GumN family protein, partial [Epsilonproteobacteria bacterium]|nr:TraB/GumN family protein [Campylobacterota bacterium]
TRGKERAYLLGTMHIPDPGYRKLHPEIDKALSESKGIYTEVTMEPSSQMYAIRLMMNGGKRTLRTLLPPALYQRSEAYLHRINPMLSMAPFEKMKLWAFSAALPMLKIQMKYPETPAIDGIIYQTGLTLEKEVGGIERVDEQLAGLNALSDSEQLLMFEETLTYLETESDYIETMHRLYTKGDGNVLLTFMHEMMFQKSETRALEKRFMQLLLYDRNQRMAERMIDKLEKNPGKTYLFAFGVMHFLGEKSVIELLERKGYCVMRMR